MTSHRSQAYGRVMDAIREVGPSKLLPAEQEILRDAADALLFCDDLSACPDTTAAVDAVGLLLCRLVESERWLAETAERLVADVMACGPLALV